MNEWISVKERLPDGAYSVVIYNGKAMIGWFDVRDSSWHHNNNLRVTPNHVTHWMPLPEPPKQGR